MTDRRTARPKLSVLMPTLNESGSIEKVVQDIKANAGDLELEILIVDSSTDETPEIARRLGCVVHSQPKQGPGKAIIAGLKVVTGDLVLTADCDDTYPMEDIPKFIEAWRDGADFVNGSRMNTLHDSMPPLNRFGNWLFAFLVRTLYRIPIRDVTTGMRLFTRELVESEEWETNLAFWAEIVIKSVRSGFKFVEFPIDYRVRVGDVKLNVWKSGWAFIFCIFKYRFGLGFLKNEWL